MKKPVIYSRSARSGLSPAFALPPPEPPLHREVWNALKGFYRRHERAVLLASGPAAAVLAVLIYFALQPAPKELTQRDIERLLDQLEDLARSGARDQAQDLLSQLQDMMNNLQAGRQQNQQGGQQSEMQQQMNELGEMLRRQQELMNETFQTDQMRPGSGAALCRSAGMGATLVAREADWAQINLPSGEIRRIPSNCRATLGKIGNADQMNIVYGKAGRKRWLGIRPHNRGVSMNPVDHPHGGGEGRTSGGRHPVTPWGKPTKGKKTRTNKTSGKFIMRSRHERKK